MVKRQTVKQVHTVIFDLDGTISDTVILTMRSLNRYAPGYGLEVPAEENVRASTGYAAAEFYRRMFPGAPQDVIDIAGPVISQGEMEELDVVKEKVLFDGCLEMLERLKGLGVKIYIASTGSRHHVYSIISKSGIENYFDMISCECTEKTGVVREMIGGGDKGGFVFVGDMIIDQVAARENEIVSIGACYGYCDRETADFDLYIDHPLELFDILEFQKTDD